LKGRWGGFGSLPNDTSKGRRTCIMSRSKTVENKGGSGNTVRLHSDLFNFDKISNAKMSRAGLELTAVHIRASWGLKEDTIPQTLWFHVNIDKDLQFKAREWKRADISCAILEGKQFFAKRDVIKRKAPYITFKIFKVVLRHKKSGNVYYGVVKGCLNTRQDSRNMFVMKMNGKPHNKLTGIEYGTMIDDLTKIMYTPCHYSYESARIVVCPAEKE
jgi:hypothetical protein